MKQLIATLLITLISLGAFGQVRENTTIDLQIVQKSPMIKKLTAWFKENGQWQSRPNIIDNGMGYRTGQVHQNCGYMQIISLRYNKIPYYALLCGRVTGYYKYPNIMEDWIEDYTTEYVVFDSTQYVQFKEIINKQTGKNEVIHLKRAGVISTGNFRAKKPSYYYEGMFLQNLPYDLTHDAIIERCFRINSQVVNNVSVVRFRIPEHCNKGETDFNERYFEVTLDEFKQLLIN